MFCPVRGYNRLSYCRKQKRKRSFIICGRAQTRKNVPKQTFLPKKAKSSADNAQFERIFRGNQFQMLIFKQILIKSRNRCNAEKQVQGTLDNSTGI